MAIGERTTVKDQRSAHSCPPSRLGNPKDSETWLFVSSVDQVFPRIVWNLRVILHWKNPREDAQDVDGSLSILTGFWLFLLSSNVCQFTAALMNNTCVQCHKYVQTLEESGHLKFYFSLWNCWLVEQYNIFRGTWPSPGRSADTDSKGLMTVALNWVGEGKDPLLRHSPDGDILAHIIKVLHQRVSLGLFTMFIKIRAHRGEFLNEKADRWADEGRVDIDNVRWDGPSLQPTFSWIEGGVEHRCSMNKTLRTRVQLKVSELQLPLYKNHTSEFLKREDNSRDLLGKHWQDKTVADRSKRRLLQSISHLFPCAKLLKLWGLRDDV